MSFAILEIFCDYTQLYLQSGYVGVVPAGIMWSQKEGAAFFFFFLLQQIRRIKSHQIVLQFTHIPSSVLNFSNSPQKW